MKYLPNIFPTLGTGYISSSISIFLHAFVHFDCGILSAICHTLSQLDDVGDKFSAFHSLSLPLKWCPSIYLKYAHIQIIYKRAPGGSVVQVIDNINRAVLLLARLHRELQKRVEDQGKDEEEAGG